MNASPKAVCPPPRINRACGRCRVTKARCLPSAQPLICQRLVSFRASVAHIADLKADALRRDTSVAFHNTPNEMHLAGELVPHQQAPLEALPSRATLARTQSHAWVSRQRSNHTQCLDHFHTTKSMMSASTISTISTAFSAKTKVLNCLARLRT